MNKNLIEVVFIIDRSGSMSSLTNETIGGFNSMIEKQKNDTEGEVRITTVLFDNCYEILHDHVDVREVQTLTRKEYYPRGTTALLDAVGRTIDSVGERLAATPEEERPGTVMFVITTDGYENASHDYTQARVKEMIEHQKSKYSWVFMFLGANIDAEQVGTSYGIDSKLSMTYTASSRGVTSVYDAVSDSITVTKAMTVRERGIATEDCIEALRCVMDAKVE